MYKLFDVGNEKLAQKIVPRHAHPIAKTEIHMMDILNHVLRNAIVECDGVRIEPKYNRNKFVGFQVFHDVPLSAQPVTVAQVSRHVTPKLVLPRYKALQKAKAEKKRNGANTKRENVPFIDTHRLPKEVLEKSFELWSKDVRSVPAQYENERQFFMEKIHTTVSWQRYIRKARSLLNKAA